MKTDLIKIVIVDDHPIVIEGLKMMLKSEPLFSISQSFTSGIEAVNFINSDEADIVFLDIALPDSNGINLCKEIKKKITQYLCYYV
ncbi:response regulator transcription factor [Chryseobacterium proteolyticum]|uniref:response regulator transcription factor n=1 Tax=Chryseobacterium proteolyticum TaxID=118127 RepID=UPI00398323DE